MFNLIATLLIELKFCLENAAKAQSGADAGDDDVISSNINGCRKACWETSSGKEGVLKQKRVLFLHLCVDLLRLQV